MSYQQPCPTPAQGAPKQLAARPGGKESPRQGIEQPLGHGQVLAPPPGRSSTALLAGRQAMQLTKVVQQPGAARQGRLAPVLGPARRGASEWAAHQVRMVEARANRLVEQRTDQGVEPPAQPPALEDRLRQRGPGWPQESLPLAEALQRSLAIGDRDWHALKGQRPRRAAEQLAGALVQLLAADAPARATSNEARQRAIALTANALAWLQGELKDPGCPEHGR